MTYPLRLSAVAVALVLGLVAVPALAPVDAPAHAGGEDRAAVIVQAPGAESAIAAAVRRLGGTVTHALPIVSGFSALVPAAAVDALATLPGVRAVTPDGRMEPTAATKGGGLQTVNSVFTRETGADVLAAGGATGEGIRVALIDTGVDTAVAATGDLAGKVVPVDDPATAPTLLQPDPPDVDCVNFSGEETCDDSFGHGTFMAGLIAGSGAASDGRFTGTATGAEIVSVKVGGADGSADVSKVLAGIQWVVSFADRYDIRVLNLSMGTDSTVHPDVDPLNLAVQRAWVSGITVVVSAGNFGPGPRTRPDGSSYGTVTKPGDDPFVITVGAVDDRESPGIDDDPLPAFTSWGPTIHGLAKPDVVAPGGRVVSLRAPGSVIDQLPGILDGSYRRGSGTSMAAAITSGLAAQLLDARPDWRPDDVKAALVTGARKVNFRDARAVGAGMVNGPAALEASISPTYRESVLSDGSGSLDGSRGSNIVDGEPCDPLIPMALDDCRELDDDETAQGNNWQGEQYAESEWTPETWYESQWVKSLGNNWQGNNWQGNNWQASTWAEGNNWQGNNWQGSTWNGQTDDRSYGTEIPGSGSYGAWG